MTLTKNTKVVSLLQGDSSVLLDRNRFEGLLSAFEQTKTSKPLDRKAFRAFIILAWLSGAWPKELLSLEFWDLRVKKDFLQVKLPGSRCQPRVLKFPMADPLVDEVAKFAGFGAFPAGAVVSNTNAGKHPSPFLFACLRSNAKQSECLKVWRAAKVFFGYPMIFFRLNRAGLLLPKLSLAEVCYVMGWKKGERLALYFSRLKQKKFVGLMPTENGRCC